MGKYDQWAQRIEDALDGKTEEEIHSGWFQVEFLRMIQKDIDDLQKQIKELKNDTN